MRTYAVVKKHVVRDEYLIDIFEVEEHITKDQLNDFAEETIEGHYEVMGVTEDINTGLYTR